MIVHPRLAGSQYPSGDLCGAGVAFKLAWQVCKGFGDGKKASPHLRDYLVRALGLVALATIADVVPLSDENRIMVRHGLSGIEGDPSIGMRALLEVSGCLDKKTVDVRDGRLHPRPSDQRGRPARTRHESRRDADDRRCRAGESRSPRSSMSATPGARRSSGRSTKKPERMIEAWGGVKDRGAIVLASKGWHAGVIGIVAGRLVENYHRPTIVLAIGEAHAQGSARSIPGFDLYEAIKDCSGSLIGFGGHAAAAGLKVAEEHLADFARLFEERCRNAPLPRATRARPDHRRRSAARRPESPRRGRDRKARAVRDRQPEAAPAGQPAPGRRGAADRRRTEEASPASTEARRRHHEGDRAGTWPSGAESSPRARSAPSSFIRPSTSGTIAATSSSRSRILQNKRSKTRSATFLGRRRSAQLRTACDNGLSNSRE